MTSESGCFGAGAVHETTSDFPKEMHEVTSESVGVSTDLTHETKSEIRRAMWEELHETASEQGTVRAGAVHEVTSESADPALEKIRGSTGKSRDLMHETKSESGSTAPGSMHEIRSEVRDILHEMESEFTDRVARGLLDGLRRAAAVR